jgi:glycosyltransferase involved in cell wall biosynthesis
MTNPDLNSAPRSTPLVSVAITTYNSSNYLSRSLDSVLKQRTNFPIEIVIGDDCSTDSTVSVARAYQQQHPDVIQVIARSKNLGMCRNYYETFEQCRGRYIAWLDADDYWTDPEKLAIQAETLESDSSIKVCCHYVQWVTSDGVVEREKFPTIAPGRYGLSEIIHHNFLPSPSVMFRNGIHRGLPSWYFDIAPTTDWPLHVVAALSGDIVLLDRIMADYMLTPGSSYMSKGSLFWYKNDARFYEHIVSVLPAKWQRRARAEQGRRYESLSYWLRKQGDFRPSREAAFKAFSSPSLLDNWGSKTKTLLAALVRETESKFQRQPTADQKP